MRWILWCLRMILAIGMMAALVVKPDPRLFFGIATLWIVTKEILDFGLEIRRYRIESWTPGKKKPRGWQSPREWERTWRV